MEANSPFTEQARLMVTLLPSVAKQACFGAARMMIESGEPPDVLRAKVASAGGTTEAAMASMADDHVFDHIGQAVIAAWKRSQELGT